MRFKRVSLAIIKSFFRWPECNRRGNLKSENERQNVDLTPFINGSPRTDSLIYSFQIIPIAIITKQDAPRCKHSVTLTIW